MCHILASGVFFSGFVKDMICLPRPLSPPLHRISKSASVALEYGFPSTHSTNAVSVALYAIHAVQTSTDPSTQSFAPWVPYIAVFYATSIIIGRIYCGMHGFFDVVIGSLMGVILADFQIRFGELFDTWIATGPISNVLIAALIMLILVRIHPEPADNCPCFDDSVAFSGVFIGIQIGCWHFARTPYSIDTPMPSTAPFSIAALGWPVVVIRILLGVMTVFAWRAIAKPTLLYMLPPIFRIVGRLGLLLPRKFFLSVTQYREVPPLRKDDNVIPPASEIPGMLNSLAHPRKRTISVGPQSEADAYEAMAFRQRKRRESQTGRASSPPSPKQPAALGNGAVNGMPKEHLITPATEGVIDEDNDEELFEKLLRPRVRYDVEVVTKLIVYTGIALFASELNPLLFEFLGLAPGR